MLRKCFCYKLFKDKFGFELLFVFETLFKLHAIFWNMPLLLEQENFNNKFPVETGSWNNVTAQNRICELSTKGTVGDEFNYFLECEFSLQKIEENIRCTKIQKCYEPFILLSILNVKEIMVKLRWRWRCYVLLHTYYCILFMIFSLYRIVLQCLFLFFFILCIPCAHFVMFIDMSLRNKLWNFEFKLACVQLYSVLQKPSVWLFFFLLDHRSTNVLINQLLLFQFKVVIGIIKAIHCPFLFHCWHWFHVAIALQNPAADACHFSKIILLSLRTCFCSKNFVVIQTCPFLNILANIIKPACCSLSLSTSPGLY